MLVTLSVQLLACVLHSDTFLSLRPTVLLSPGILSPGLLAKAGAGVHSPEGEGDKFGRKTNYFASNFYDIVLPS